MSNKTLVRGISAAAILAILSGAAYGELANDLKATKSNGLDNNQNASAILGGSSITGGFGGFSLVSSRGSNNFAARLGSSDAWNDGKLMDDVTGSWSVLAVVKPSTTANSIIWSTGRGYGGKKGLVVIQREDGVIELASWNLDADPQIVKIVDSDTTSLSTDTYHSVFVTHSGTTYTLYVDGVSVGSADSEADVNDSGFQIGSIHGNTKMGLNGGGDILLDEMGVWSSKCLTAEEVKTVSSEFVYQSVHSISLSVDSNWSAIKPESISANDIIEITSANKTLTFDESDTVIPCKVVFVSGITRVVNPSNVTMTSEVVVNQGAELWIDCAGIVANNEVPTIADDITVYGTIRPHGITTTAGGDAVNTDETTKVIFPQNMTLNGGELHIEDGNVVLSGAIKVAEGTTAKYTPKWRKATIIKNLNVPETSTFKMIPNLGNDAAGSIIKIAGGTIDGRVELSGNNKATKLQASDALAGKTLYLTSGGKIDLSGQTVGFEKIVVEGGTTAAPNEITGNGNNGTVEIAANAVVKDIHTGANKIYTYSGAGSTSSTLIVTGSQNWGIADNAKSALSNLKLSVQDASHHFFVERAIGADVALEVGEGATVKVANVHHSFKTISGTGSIVTSQWPGANPGIILNSASTFEGTITTPVKLADGSSLTLTNGGTISADPTTDVAKKRVNKVVTTEGEGEEAVTTTAYTLVDLVTLKIPVIAHTIAQYRYSAADEWTSVTTTEGEYNTVVVDKSVGFFFQYISEDETKWTVSGDQSGYKYSSGLAQDTTYDAPKTGITVTPVTPPSPTVPKAIEGGSQEQQTAYATWATANGVSGSATAKLADAFAIGATGTDEESVLADAQDELVAILATLDLTKITTEAFSLPAYPNAIFQFVEASLGEGVTTTANLFHLTVEFRPANSEE